ncbi:flagellar biosynthetic protein FliO [Qipengyuania sp. DGS5-3]|uniref:flagellar biosynthetic protein FliO n=1 Tax=Qipengyuania sp. DGS5-3 TaxID=3349632 RepID=UPI0036D41DDC
MSIGTVLSSMLAIIISLAFVIALAFGGLWLLRKFQDGSFGKLRGEDTGRTLRFERALPVGQRERLVIVEVDGEHMLLGVTAHSITQLKTWPAEPGSVGGSASSQDNGESADKFRLRMAKDDRL